MKKIVLTITVIALLVTGALSVSAAELEDVSGFVSRMTAETFRELRYKQIDEAEVNDVISSDQAKTLREHIESIIEDNAFGNGPQYSLNREDNEDCVLGDDGNLGIFSNANSGMRNGQGNGVGLKAQDGTQAGNGNRVGGRGGRAGQGLQDGSGEAQGYRGQANDGVCIIE